MEYYTRKDISKLTGFTPQSVNLYAKMMVTPDIANPKGKGTKRKYSKSNLREFFVIKYLKKCGQTLKQIMQVIKIMKEHDHVDALISIPVECGSIRVVYDVKKILIGAEDIARNRGYGW